MFVRSSKRFLPPFRIVYARRQRRGSAPLLVKDARDAIVGSFTRWAYAFACLEELHQRANLPPPHEPVTRRAFQEDIWQQIRKHPNSNAIQKHFNRPYAPQ
jgi:hypothetical protein